MFTAKEFYINSKPYCGSSKFILNTEEANEFIFKNWELNIIVSEKRKVFFVTTRFTFGSNILPEDFEPRCIRITGDFDSYRQRCLRSCSKEYRQINSVDELVEFLNAGLLIGEPNSRKKSIDPWKG